MEKYSNKLYGQCPFEGVEEFNVIGNELCAHCSLRESFIKVHFRLDVF